VLEQRSRGRSIPARAVERARIILLAAGGKQNKEIACELQISEQKSARWRARFLELGITGLEKDAPRPGRTPTIPAAVVKRVIRMTTKDKPKNATQWSTRMMAEAVGISEASVRRIWHKNGLKPHLVDTYKVSNEPAIRRKTRSGRRSLSEPARACAGCLLR